MAAAVEQVECELHSACITGWLCTQPAFPADRPASGDSTAAADISSLHLGPARAVPLAVSAPVVRHSSLMLAAWLMRLALSVAETVVACSYTDSAVLQRHQQRQHLLQVHDRRQPTGSGGQT